MSSTFDFRTADPVEAVIARLRVAAAEPLLTAVDDLTNFRLTARPGEAPLIGRVSGTHFTVWRRGVGNWVGLTAFKGEVLSLETGSAVIGVSFLRFGRTSAAFLIVLAAASLILAAAVVGWSQFASVALF